MQTFKIYSSSINDSDLLSKILYRRSTVSAHKHDESALQRIEQKIETHKEQELELKKSRNILEKRQDDAFIKVYFANSKEELKAVSLSSSSIAYLKHNFTDVYDRKDGSVFLNNESAAYVAGWYDEIAYTRGYLEADEDKNNLIDDKELVNLNSFFHPYKYSLGCKDGKFDLFGLFSYKSLQMIAKQEVFDELKDVFAQESINVALDKTILLDSDFDGKVLYQEAFSMGNGKKVMALLLEGDMNASFSDEVVDLTQKNKSKEELLAQKRQEMLDEVNKAILQELTLLKDGDEEEKNKIRSKLLANGLSALSVEERELARKYFPNLIKDTQDSKGIDSLIKDLQTNFLKIRDNALNLNV